MKTVVILASLVVAYLLFLSFLAARSRTVPRLEVRDGRFKACPRASNCVNTQDSRRGIAPLPVSGDAATAFGALREVVAALPNTRLLANTTGYLRAECTSPFFGFRDDLEALLDPTAGVIHLRSASRVGIRDRGVNLARIEEVRRRYLERTQAR